MQIPTVFFFHFNRTAKSCQHVDNDCDDDEARSQLTVIALHSLYESARIKPRLVSPPEFMVEYPCSSASLDGSHVFLMLFYF
jgi:hypothetical protein